MTQGTCWIAGDTKLETPEGPLTVKSLAAKPAPVLTRESGRVRFRRLLVAELLSTAQPTVRISLEGGSSFRAGLDQVVVMADGGDKRASELSPGDLLSAAFTYPKGYGFRVEGEATEAVSEAGIRVESVEPGGDADLYRLVVNVSGCFFVAAGVLCRATPD